MLSNDGNVAICMRVEGIKHSKCYDGWIHHLHTPEEWVTGPQFRAAVRENPELAHKGDLHEEEWLRKIYDELDFSEETIYRIALQLGVTEDALRRMGAGYSKKRRVIAFPMYNANGEILGIRYRSVDGKFKYAEKGGHNGIFLAKDDSVATDNKKLIVVEGATDFATLKALGLNGVGRPDCQGGKQLIRDVLDAHPEIKEVDIIADCDEAGMNGAEDLASFLNCRHRIVVPPSGIKDLRQWYKTGELSSPEQLLERIQNAKLIQPMR